MVDNLNIAPTGKFKTKTIKSTTNTKTDHIEPVIAEEKVDVLIKEIIRIKPSDFSAFKHALEDFVKSWEK